MKKQSKIILFVILIVAVTGILIGVSSGKIDFATWKSTNSEKTDVSDSSEHSQTITETTEDIITETEDSSSASVTDENSEKSSKKSTTTKDSRNETPISTLRNQTTMPKTNDNYCTISISCKTIADNRDKLKTSKAQFIPSDYQIFKEKKVLLNKNESAFDLLERVCKENMCSDKCKYCEKNGIQLEFNYTPAFESYYIEGIHQLYEKDCGTKSGWVFKVNGQVSDMGSNNYIVKNGDKIEWLYTCNSGEDVY